ncbi:uncharacterized protein LOC111634915 [Centruroides sculpturatus]|uniref:uncharacterized protein LOC111634915 n=1 Tax=Centruroides sculpturatus TaxID=218467 RepID=UPI000C6DA0F5|nr:uncharacterized protein LOC111634915 [Centruroides sculpturatus]
MIHHIARNSWGISSKHCRLIYKGAIEPALLYAAQIWGDRADIVHNKRKLLSVQRSFAIRVCRAYRTAPTDGLLTIANLTPIHLRIREVFRHWKLINKDWKNKEVESYSNNMEGGDFCPEDPELNDQIAKNGIDLFANEGGNPSHPAEHCSINIENGDNPNGPTYNWHIFTDGASNSQGTGAAFVVYRANNNEVVHEEYFKLGAFCTNNQAELWAMNQALTYVIKHIKYMPGSMKFITDSRYTLRNITNNRRQTAIGVKVYHMARHLHRSRMVSFGWVPGHAGVHGNERADGLAKKAANNNITISFSKLPLKYIHKQLTSRIMTEWQNEWSSSSTGRTTYDFLPSITSRQSMNYLTPSYHLTQALTGHGNIPTYLHCIKKRDDDHCVCDGLTTGNIYHIITECRNHDAQRRRLIDYCVSNGLNWPPPWELFCATKDLFIHFENFIRDCGIFVYKPPD